MSGAARALVLDFGGVITRTLFETHAETETTLGLPPGTLSWMGPFDPAGDSLWRSMQAGDISERDYWLARTHETGKLIGEDWDRMDQFLRRARGGNTSTELMKTIRPEALAAIETAKAAGKKLAILSNELDLFYGADFRNRLPFLGQFDLIVDATYTKVLKPDPRAYAFVTDGLDIEAKDCVFVDDQSKNVRGAEAAGMRALRFDVRDPAASFSRALALLGISTASEARHDVA